LIVLVHQPTMLHSFEGRIQQVFPDSRELSMSSAKTIADILAFAELIDVKSFIGNPFTSQPIYVAACAFLAEAAAHASQPPSRATPPPTNGHGVPGTTPSEHKAASARHTLLATAANQNYQRCYKALKTLGSYWAGCRYILTALDQKSKGLMDPLLFTAEDLNGEMPSTEPSFTTPGWRRSTSLAASLGAHGGAFRRLGGLKQFEKKLNPPKMDLGQAIGWSLTGTANSPAPNISFLYPHTGESNGGKVPSAALPTMGSTEPISQSRSSSDLGPLPPTHSPSMSTARDRLPSLSYDPVSTAEADLLLGLHSPYATSSTAPALNGPGTAQHSQTTHAVQPPATLDLQPQQYLDAQSQNFHNMLVESQDIDMSGHPLDFDFLGGDMIPWLEYLPQDVLNYFGDSQGDGPSA